MKPCDLFKAIFSDAQVLDVDFSSWDNCIQLCVVGSDVEFPIPKQLPLFMVEFRRVSSFQCSFRHLDIQLEKETHHFQWHIHDFNISNTGQETVIALIGAGASPNLKITCAGYDIRSLSHNVLDKLFPGWRQPYGPLVRPSIEAMERHLGKKSNR